MLGSQAVLAAIVVGVAVLWGASLFAVSGGGGDDRTAAIGAQGEQSPPDAVRGQYEASAAAADKADREKPASEQSPPSRPGR